MVFLSGEWAPHKFETFEHANKLSNFISKEARRNMVAKPWTSSPHPPHTAKSVSPAAECIYPFVATHVGEVKTDAKVVIGVDFGTTFSSVSFIYPDSPTKVNCGAPGAKTRDEIKVPTVLLKKGPDGWSFGHAALETYYTLLESCQDDDDQTGPNLNVSEKLKMREVSLFRHFKLQLKSKSSGFDTLTANSTMGEAHNLMDLVARSLGFLSRFALEEVKSGWASALDIAKEDILWVLTVPAIWNDFGKAFMRRAACRAGMIDDEGSERLLLALEPESASIAVHGEGTPFGLFKEGSSFMMLDCGGGTVDITLHRVSTENPLVLDEISCPVGGPWGGLLVDLEFKSFLRDLFGETRLKILEANHPVEVAEAVEEFRLKKEEFNPEEGSDTLISLAGFFSEDVGKDLVMPSLLELLTTYNAEEKHKPFDITDRRKKKRIDQFSTLAFSPDHMLQFFELTLNKITDAVKRLLTQHPEIDIVAVVGGYGSSKALGQRIRAEFEGAPFHKTVVIPDVQLRPQAAVVHGAAYFGLYTSVIGTRIAKHTYGVETTTRWYEGCGYPESEAEFDSKLQEKRVRQKFSRIVKKGQSISPMEVCRSSDGFSPLYEDQKNVRFAVFKSDQYNPKRTTGCDYLGEIVVPCRHMDDSFRVEFTFTSELRVEIVRKDGERNFTTVRME